MDFLYYQGLSEKQHGLKAYYYLKMSEVRNRDLYFIYRVCFYLGKLYVWYLLYSKSLIKVVCPQQKLSYYNYRIIYFVSKVIKLEPMLILWLI